MDVLIDIINGIFLATSNSGKFILNQNLRPEFDIFFKKRNKYGAIFHSLNFIYLLFMILSIMFIINKDDTADIDIQTYSTFSVYTDPVVLITVGYFAVVLLTLPLLFKMMTYVPVCNIITYSQKFRDLFHKREELLLQVAEIDHIDTIDLKKFFKEYDAYKHEVINHKMLDLENAIRQWIEINKDKFNKKQLSEIEALQSDIRNILSLFLKEAIKYYKNYGRKIGKFKAPAIPPLFFTDEDIAVFRETEENYIGE